ncbi:discoidin domain-containing protein [Pseudoalteromonas peptidolytica]|uniref:discoidin domain-containing protein n=1 Tax=Pseudoalteromonas peptidolytica TaxID=61150 RepID=UPI00116979EA|nr:discoidin domain-containing protein [Pseudoalteromonas peptidolytica]NLR15279.1 discoidin domain-containing protein [Pseudoalteromonas peptidolytica]GEK08040.1 hypothetical protein PPE03_02890 [Pseudoalteromonas peptidolytica]
MVSQYYWVNKKKLATDLNANLPTFDKTLWHNDLSQGALFCLDSRPVEELAAYLRLNNGLSKNDINLMLSAGHKPAAYRDMPRLEVNDEGIMSFRWPQETEGGVFPLYLHTGELRSFVFVMTQLDGVASVDANLSVRGYVFFVGTVGKKGSGADLEIEHIEDFAMGRGLFLEQHQVPLPFYIHQPHQDVCEKPQQLSLPSTNGLVSSDFTGFRNAGPPYSGARFWTYTLPFHAFQSGGLWLSDQVNGTSYLQVDFKTLQRTVVGLHISGETQRRNRCPKQIEFLYSDAAGNWSSAHTFVIEGVSGVETLYLPTPIHNVKSIRLQFTGVLAPDWHRNWYGTYDIIYTYTTGVNDVHILGIV